jgi:outer membrane protein OmpA-like peptidoglycan-associated protein
MGLVVRISILFTLCAALLGPTASAQKIVANTPTIETAVQRLNDAVKQARADNLHLSSPSAFRDASEYLADAQDKMKEGDKLSDIRRAVQRGHKRLADAKKFTDIGGVLLNDAFAARDAALDVRAPEFSTDHWTDGEEALRSAGSEIEKGDQNNAREDATEAENHYRAAELNAIQVNLLGTARTHRRKAQEAGADEWARQTWKTADQKLQEADRLLKTDRYDRTESRALAEEATEQFKRARRLAEQAKRIDDDVEKNAERVLLTYEAHVRRLAEALGTPVSFGEGPDVVTERLVAAVQSQHADRKNLQESLQERGDRIDRLQQMTDSLDTRLASLEQRESTMSTQLQAQRDRDRMLSRVREVFQPEEAEVLTSGDAVIVRMKGLNFASGSAEIQPKNFGLLTKLQQVIREFPGPITISGHTDAEGNDALNMKLSEQRSDAVHQYLTANMDLAPDRIRAVGRGESEPIATNETEDGRLQNRRIDVTIGFQ